MSPDSAPRPEPARKRHRWRRRSLLVLGSTLVSLMVAECGVRVLVGAPMPERLPILEIQAHPTCGWRMVPGREHFTYQHRVQVNTLGLRGPEPGPKKHGEVRVLALGDSLVYGQGVGDTDTVPAYLEAALRQGASADQQWSVVNGGHRAWDTRQELALAEELAPRLRPDVVVVFWFWNDLKERDVEATYQRLQDSGPIAFDTSARMEGWVRLQWHALQLVRRSALAMFLHDLVQRPDPTKGHIPPWDVDPAMQRLDGYLAGFEVLARNHPCELVFAVIPDPNSLPQEFFSRDYDRRALEVARTRGWTTLDLHDTVRQLYQDTGALPVLPYDGHYRPAANQAMAEAVAPVVLQIHAGATAGR